MNRLNVLHGCCTVQGTKGYNFLVDKEDFEKLSKLRWHSIEIRSKCDIKLIYACHDGRSSNKSEVRTGSSFYLHNFLIGCKGIDHKNGDTRDNRKENLRRCTVSENGMNKRKSYGSSQYKGVSMNANANKWASQIYKNGKRIFLGYFDYEEEAAKKYNEAARIYFGEFAKLNEIA